MTTLSTTDTRADKSNAPTQKKWGPVLATRMRTRVTRDGRIVDQKAQDLLKQHNKNLELNTSKSKNLGNSFAVQDNASLMLNARMAGVVLGASETEIEDNISCIKSNEHDRLEKIHDCHRPDMFLPQNINILGEEHGIL